MIRTRWKKLVLLTLWTFLILFPLESDSNSQDPFSSQPRIMVEDGNLIFKSAENRDVSITTRGKGSVKVNNDDLSNVLSLVISFITGGGHSESTLAYITQKIADLQNHWNSMSSVTNQVEQLQQNFTTLNRKVNRFVGTGQRALSNQRLREAVRKITTLETKLRRLTELLTADECSSNPCRNGGTCVDVYNGFTCKCTPGWEGVTCESDVNECGLYAGTHLGCQNGATCYNSPGSYRCHCSTNYYGIHCSERHDDCTSASHQELCGHGTCINEPRSQPGQPKFRCLCNAGWKTGNNGPACTEDVDECAEGEMKCSTDPQVLCINLPGTFHCGPCPHGYTGNGRTCSDINECEVNNGGCSTDPRVPCINTIGSRTCGPCPAGYQANGFQCDFVGICNINRGGCHPLATCTQNIAISVTYRECRCPVGYIGNGEGLTGCVYSVGTSCSNNPCVHGSCEVVGNSFHCSCFPNYSGTLCDIQINSCSSNPCENGGTCTSTFSGFTCVCLEEWEGNTCSERKQSCGGHIVQNNGTLSFPYNQGIEYRHRENCVWVIVVEDGKVLNFSFTRFHLEGGPNCEYDYVEIRDGPTSLSHPIGKFCSDGPIQSFLSVHNSINIAFRTDESVAGNGFTLQWNATEPLCGGELEEATHGAINSPGYPGKYPANRDCYWLVKVAVGKRIQFHFATLQMEHHENCSFDFLKIYDGANEHSVELARFCTTELPRPVTTSGSHALLHFHSDYSQEDTGFHIIYAALPGIPGCGGTMTTPSGTIASPNYPNVYNHLLRCEWLIRVHPSDRIQLSFSTFSLEQHRNCQFDFVAVYDGDSSSSNILGRYCGTSIPPDLLSNSNLLFIQFHTDYSVASKGFQMTYRTVCGGTYTELDGSFHTPHFPDNYPSSVTCFYKISLPTGYLIELYFPFFDIESGLSECGFDFLEVRDGGTEQSALIGHFCGRSLPDPVSSTYNELWLKFASDGSVENRGFYANYTSYYLGCGGVITNTSGHIGTPSHQTLYPPSITCTWLLRAPPGFAVRLTFDKFNLESHAECKFDYVLVKDSNGAQIGKYCGYTIPPILTSTNNEMHVIFSADASVSHEGFSASYVFLDTSHACGGDYYIESGVIRSPKFPENYPHSRICVWVLHAANGHQFLLNTTTFELESHESCKYDFLEIRNGGSPTSPIIGKYCGQTILPPITSHSNKIRLEFRSDSSQSAKGFEIFYDSTSTGCGGKMNSPRGSIVSPNYPLPYTHNADCSWTIHVSEGSAISVVIVDVDIEEHVSCDFDFLQIFDGDSNLSPSLAKVCNNQHIPSSIVSRSNIMFVKFRTDMFDSGRGFHLVYQTLCNTILTKHRGVIESPNFPNTYPHNHNCNWTIAAPLGNNVSLAFSHLRMEGGSSCDADFIEVIEVFSNRRNNSLAKFCGTPLSMPEPIKTSTNTVLVRLVTDRSISFEGFRLEWNVVGCGGELNRQYGVISSPNFPNGYPTSISCHWHIKYPPGSRVQLIITDLDVETVENCVFDYVQVFGGEDTNSPRLLKECKKIFSGQERLTSHGNHMTIVFHSDDVIIGKGFRAIYQKLSSGCGGYYSTSESSIISPNYPLRYAPNDECEWMIVVDPNHVVVLEFDAFEMPSSVNCTSGVVIVYDGFGEADPVLMNHCGGMPNNSVITSTSNKMTIRLRADGRNVAKGFHARYKTGCGARLLADDGGEITSPNYPHLNSAFLNCSWIIYASDPGEKVTLTLTHIDIMGAQECSSGYVQINDGDLISSPLIQKICDNHVPPQITSQGNSLHVFLHSRGIFRATYGITSSYCGGEYKSESGSISSPDYPSNYPMNTECIWTISASAGNKVLLSFSIFQMEESDYCNRDYVEIHEDNAGGNLIGRYCGNQIPTNITAAHKIWMKFQSDDLSMAQGFLARFGLLHGTELNGTSGIIECPGYPHPFRKDDEFLWQITVPNGYYVSITFLLMQIPSFQEGEDCRAGIKIYDGPGTTSPQIGDYLCGFRIPDIIISHGNQVSVKFIAKRYVPSVWKLQWNAVSETSETVLEPEGSSSSCWHELHVNSSESKVIESPGYPFRYEKNLNCTWIIRTSSHDHIKLNFSDISIEGYHAVCAYDRIDIYTLTNSHVGLWNLNYTVCGRKTNMVLESVNNIVKIQFITDFMWNYKGFNLTAEAVCGSVMSEPSGIINSSNLVPYLRQQHIELYQCDWVINVKSRRTIQISFDTFNIPTTTGATCNPSYLMLLNGGFSTSPSLGTGRYCGSSLPSVPESVSNKVFVRLQINSFSTVSPQFALQYVEVSVGCGGQVLLSNDGLPQYVKSPNYPNPPPHDIECVWIIMSPSSTRIRIDFDDEFHFSENCYEGENTEYVLLLDGGTELAQTLRRFCYNQHASSVMSTGNVLYVKYFTAATHPMSGFKGKVQTAECGGIITTVYGEITSPKYPQNYESGVECEWEIKLNQGYSSYLVITDLETPANSDCYSTDYLEIRDQDKNGDILRTYCGLLPNRTTIELPGNTAYIKFKTDGSETGKGFQMYLHTDYRKRCGGYHSLPSGTITSPGYPAASSSRHSCEWVIKAPDGRRVSLKFEAFNLRRDEQTTRCINSLFIFDGLEYGRSRDGIELCGNAIPETIESSTNTLYLHFKTNGLSSGEGFIISYSTENEAFCGGSLHPPNGTFGAEDFSFTNHSWAECRWSLFSENDNQTVSIKFNTFKVPGNITSYCRNGSVQIFSKRRQYNRYEPLCGHLNKKLPFITSPFSDTMVVLLTSIRESSPMINASYNFNECGGVIDGENATIVSPGYPNNYSTNIDCHWLLKVPYGNLIGLKIVDMSLDGNCESDYIKIYNGNSLRSPLIDKLCGTTIPQTLTSSGSFLTIVFHSDQYGISRGFKMITGTTHEGCGERIHRRRGFITSPNYPNQYDTNIECVWTIEYPSGLLVNISFVGRFDIEMHSNCEKDYLLIEDFDDGVWHENSRKCGSAQQSSIMSSSTKMRITFHSDSDIKADGFQIQYSAACGGHFTDDSGSIYSPNYPDLYENNLHCKYLIGRPGQHVHLEFQSDDFNIETHSSCYYDYVAIYLGNSSESQVIGKYCGTQPPGIIDRVGQIYMEFVSDYIYSGHGFVAHYDITGCGGDLIGESGKFKSSRSKTSQVQFRECTWNITGLENRIIALRFSHMRLSSYSQCYYQFIEVREWNSTGEVIVKFCGDRSNAIVKSSTNRVTVHFSSRLYYYGQFEAAYSSTFGPSQGCGGTITSSSGEFTSLDFDKDGLYEPDLDCMWSIIASDGQMVNLTFTVFNLENAVNDTCLYDFVEIRDGILSDDPVIGRYCGSIPPSPLISSSNKISVHFHSDSQENRQGFKATFTSSQSLCGTSSVLVTNETHTLSSPGYPLVSPPNTWCRWHFYYNVSQIRQIELSFKEMDIPCSGDDYIEVRADQLYSSTYRLCGPNVPHDIFAASSIWFTFKSGSSASGKKFILDYKSASCNRTYTKNNGVIVGPVYYSSYVELSAQNCIVTIEAAEGQTISLYFSVFSMRWSNMCERDSLKIYDGGNASALMLARICGYYLPNPIFSTGNKLTLELDSESRHVSYIILYTMTDKGRGCGGQLSNIKGTFTSPLFPEKYNQSSECSWHLSVPGHHTMRLYFRSVFLNSTSGCSTNYIEIYEGHSEVLSNRIIRLCGDEYPALYTSQSNQLLVKLVTNANNTTAARFSASFYMNNQNFNIESREVIQKSIPISPTPGTSTLDLS